MLIQKLLKTGTSEFYANRYLKFIDGCRKVQTSDEIKEIHHILPQSIFPQFKNLNINKWNAINLSPRQHFVAHLILTKVFLTKENRRKMVSAFVFFHRNRKLSSKSYDNTKIELSLLMRYNNPMFDEKTRNKAKITQKKSWTAERREKQRIARTGVNNLTPAGIQRLSERWTGVKKQPRTQEHTNNILKSTAKGIYHTPFGDFYSPTQAANSENNTLNFSRTQIDRRCKNDIDGFSFTLFENKNIELRGKYEKSREQIEKQIISRSKGIYHTPFGDFYNTNQAANSPNNTEKISRDTIKKKCDTNVDGYWFTPKSQQIETSIQNNQLN